MNEIEEKRIVMGWELFISHFNCACLQIVNNGKKIDFNCNSYRSLILKNRRYFSIYPPSAPNIIELNPMEIVISGKLRDANKSTENCIEEYYCFLPETIGYFYKSFFGQAPPQIRLERLRRSHWCFRAAHYIGKYFRNKYAKTDYYVEIPEQLKEVMNNLDLAG
jgi:hypothetical protein